jgi:phenylalanyl-tRNA synthetase alpha chain
MRYEYSSFRCFFQLSDLAARLARMRLSGEPHRYLLGLLYVINNEYMENVEKTGHLHPLSLVMHKLSAIFTEMGFAIADGPEIETEFYNFDALNIPEHHPARDMWDTFWLASQPKQIKQRIKPDPNEPVLLRTHTSPVQIRYMQSHTPPIRIISPGKCFRHEATDATHEAQFYQIEGLVIAESISVAHLKGTLEAMFEKIFERKVTVRLRPSYFPFVEPGFETDMTCFKCDGKGCSTCKQTGWIEIGGSGMVHPKVLQNVKIDSKKYSGFAFGFGIDRLLMLKYSVDDIRSLYQGDLRLVTQF